MSHWFDNAFAFLVGRSRGLQGEAGHPVAFDDHFGMFTPPTESVRPVEPAPPQAVQTVLVVHSNVAAQQARVAAIVGSDYRTVAVSAVEHALPILDSHVALVLCEGSLCGAELVTRAQDLGVPVVLLVKDIDWREVLAYAGPGQIAAVADDTPLGVHDVVTRALAVRGENRAVDPGRTPASENRRRHARVPVSISVRGGKQELGTIVDLSVGGVALSTTAVLVLGEVIGLEFNLRERRIRADAEAVYQRLDGWALRFVGLSHEDLEAFREFLVEQRHLGAELVVEDLPAIYERIQDPVRAGNIMRSLIAASASGWVRGPLGDAHPIRPVVYHAEHEPVVVRWELEVALPLPVPMFVEVEGLNSRYWFPVLDAVVTGTHVDARLADWFLRSRRRVAVRRTDIRGLGVAFRHPATGAPVVGKVRDLSRRGLGFVWQGNEGLHVGMALPDFVLLADDRVVHLRAQVRSVEGSASEVRCGVRVVPLTRADHVAWNDVVNPVLSPTTRLEDGRTQELWDLYVESGYFSLSDSEPEKFAPLRTQFFEVSDRLRAAPELGAQLVWPATGPAVATMSMLRVHQSTWLAYQMAKRPGRQIDGTSRRTILRELLVHAYEHALVYPDPQWFMAVFQEDATIGRLTQYAFAQRHGDPSQAAIYPFRAVEMPVGPPRSGSEDGVEVGLATPGEKRALIDLLRRTRPGAYIEALDLTQEHLDMTSLCEEWGAAGLRREREVVVARIEGVARVAAVREAASEGLHLYRLLHCVRVFPLVASEPLAVAALLADCDAWYAARGGTSWVYLEEEEKAVDAPTLAAWGARDLGRADMVIVAGPLVPDLVEYVFEVTAEQAGGG